MQSFWSYALTILGLLGLGYSLLPLLAGGSIRYGLLISSLSISLASLCFVMFRKKSIEKNVNPPPILFTILLFAFITLNIFSIVVLWSAIYQRPLLYFLLVSSAAALIGIQIFVDEQKFKHTILVQIILLSLNLRLSTVFQYPFSFGVLDYISHTANVGLIMDQGRLPETLDKYLNFPIYHILFSMYGLVNGIPSYVTGYIVNAIASIIPTISLYILINRLTHRSVLGLLTSLFFAVTRNNVWASTIATPQYLSFSLSTPILSFAAFSPSFRMRALMLLLLSVLTITHPGYIVMFLLTIALFFVGSNLLQRSPSSLSTSFILLAVTMNVGYWMYIARNIFELYVLLLKFDKYQPPGLSINIPHAPETTILDQMDLTLLLFLFTLGILLFLSSNRDGSKLAPYALNGLILSIFIFPNPFHFTQLYYNIEGFRWGLIAEFFAVIVITIGFWWLISKVRGKIIALLLISILAAVTFFGTTNSFSALDGPLFNITPGSYFISSELSALDYAYRFSGNQTLVFDSQMLTYMRWFHPEVKTRLLRINDFSISGNDFLFVRTYNWLNRGILIIEQTRETLWGTRIFFHPMTWEINHLLGKHELVYNVGTVVIVS